MRKLNVCFRAESFVPFAYLFKKIGREKYDLDFTPVPKFGSGEEAELSVLGGEMDFILGNHYTPVAAKARGQHICWLAIPNPGQSYKLITRPEFDTPEELEGRRVMLGGGRCPELNMVLCLRQMGLDGKVQYLKPERSEGGARFYHTRSMLEGLRQGKADAALVDAPTDIEAMRIGLKVFETPPLEIISGPCITTTTDFARRDPELTKDILRAYLDAIHAFKTDKATVFDILLEEQPPAEGADPELLESWYTTRAEKMKARPIPSPAALEWTRVKASIDYPEAASVNPLRLLELEPLLHLEEEGFLNDLWGASVPD